MEMLGGYIVKRSKLAVALSLVMSLGALSPVMAADEGLDKAVDGSLIITRLGGIGAGMVLGVPVAVVRQTVKSYKDLTNKAADKVGGHEFGPSVGLVSFVTLPAAMIYGGATGTFYGTKHAFADGFNKPFHPDSYSLGKLED